MTPTRKRRLIMVALVVSAVAVAAALTVLALQQNMTYLFSPSEVDAGHAPKNGRFRLGGVVLEHSLKRASDSLQSTFVVTDRFKNLDVEFTGILPDLFREGQSIVASGELRDGRFVASDVLAKHDESYMPKEVADAIAKAKAANVDHPTDAPPAGGTP